MGIQSAAYKPLFVTPSTAGKDSTSSISRDSFDAFFSFQTPTLIKEHSAITHLAFSPLISPGTVGKRSPPSLVLSSGSKLQIYGLAHGAYSLSKSITRFKAPAYSPSYRQDGSLLVAGDATGLIQVFDLSSRAILRTLTGHDGPVRYTAFLNDKTRVLSGSDDKTVRLWDMPSEQAVHVWNEHTDYVRCGALSEETPLLFSGSYDHTVKGWDPRAPSGSAMSWDVGAPVEAMRLLPGSSLLAVAAGQKVKLFDLLRGGNAAPLVTWSNYSKTVTSLDVVENAGQPGQRVLLTGSLDHHVKGYSLETFKVVYSHKYTAPILSVGMSPNGQTLAVGMANGLLALSPRRVPKDPNAEKNKRLAAQEKLRRGSLAYFSRGSSYAGQGEDALLLSPNKKRKLAEYNRLLKSFQYGAALDAVLGKKMNSQTTIAMIKELIHRDGLLTALSGRDEHGLEPLVRFLFKHISNPSYSRLLIDIAELVLDMYAPVASQSIVVSELLHKLAAEVKEEIKAMVQMQRVLGLMDALLH